MTVTDTSVGLYIGGELLTKGITPSEGLVTHTFFDARLADVARYAIGLTTETITDPVQQSWEAIMKYANSSNHIDTAGIVGRLNLLSVALVDADLEAEYRRVAPYWAQVPEPVHEMTLYTPRPKREQPQIKPIVPGPTLDFS